MNYHKMPDKFHALAQYNAEIARGIVHTAEWKHRMILLQREFNAWIEHDCALREAKDENPT